MALAHAAPSFSRTVQARLNLYVGIWTFGALAATVMLMVASSSPQRIPGGRLATLAAVTAAAEAVILYLHHRRSREFVSLVEAAIAINILLLPPLEAVTVTLAGVLVANLIHRRAPLKLVFNLAQYAVATVAAVAIFETVGGNRADASIGTVAALLAGMGGFGLVNAASISGLVSLLERRAFTTVLRSGAEISLLTVAGNTCVGALAAVTWATHPDLVLLFIAPALILHLAYQGVVRTQELLGEVTAERDRLNRIIVGASDGIALLDADGGVDVWNPAMESLTGVPAASALGRPVGSVLSGAGLDGNKIDPAAPLTTATPEEPTSIVEMTVDHSGGGNKIVKMRHTALFDGEGVLSGDAIVVDDVTRERETERLKDDFLARVSHELRTPLTPIKGYAQTMQRRGMNMTPEKRDEVLTMIVERTNHMEAMIDDLLVVSQGGTKAQKPSGQIAVHPVNVGEVCRELVERYTKEDHAHVLQLGAPSEGVVALADPLRITQIVDALLSNAFKFSEPGSLVELDVRQDGGRILISVTDEGRGVPADHLGRIFERFHRVEDPMVMETGGMGLGLFIAQTLARAMQGDVSVESRLDEGSTFTLELPAA